MAMEVDQQSVAEPQLQVGEVIVFGDGGKTGYITRAYPMEDKFAIKALGEKREVRGPNDAFCYFKADELKRAVPLLQQELAPLEPLMAHKRPRLQEADAEPLMATEERKRELAPGRFEGRVKWYSKEKGFGKIQPLVGGGEDVFLHRNQFDAGPDGPHAQATEEGVLVSYGVTTHYDGKPCACSVQVDGVLRPPSMSESKEALGEKAGLVRELLLKGLHSGSFQVKGVGKASMEDTLIARPGTVVDSLGSACKDGVCALFGVFDGHSGGSCSDFVATNLDRSLFDCLRHQSRRDVTSEMAMRSALLATFRMTEHNYFQYLNKLEGGAAHAWASAGSTACTAVFFGPDEDGRLRLAVANAGDSRVILGTKDGRVTRLSEDHTPDVPSERKRIEQQGSSVVNASGIWRIVLPSKRGLGIAGLSVSRGFGDLGYKQPAGVVSAVPDVNLRVLDLREDCFVIFGSDGIWNPVSDTDAVRIVAASLREGGGDDPAAAARHAARVLVEEAHRRDGNDDKTAVVIWFGGVPDAPPRARRTHTTPSNTGVAKMAPRQVLMQGQSLADDMFAVKHALAAASQKSEPPAPPAELSDLDDLFSTYARDMGQ